MKRAYRKLRKFNLHVNGFGIGLTLFIAFVAFRILTPANYELARIASPDGEKTARLSKFYYTSQPSYKVCYRKTGQRLWHNLFYLPAYTNVPHQTATEIMEWSPDSMHLYFLIDGDLIWEHSFDDTGSKNILK